MITQFRGKYRFLSNFFYSSVYYEGEIYPTSEHAYQAAKSLNTLEREKIKKATSPGKAKRLGKRINIRQDWEEIKYQTMRDIVLSKFSRNKDLAIKLMATKDEQLIEGNTWHDNIWGSCSCIRCKKTEGQNLLGKALMEVRYKLSILDCF